MAEEKEKTEKTESQEDSTEESQKDSTEESQEDSQKTQPDTAPLSVVKDLRDEKRRLFTENLALQQQVQELQPKETTSPKSPLEEWVEENPGYSPDGETLLAQKRYEEAQAAAKSEQVKTQQQQTDYNTGIQDAVLNMSDDQKGEGLGFTVMQAMGQHLLTRGDQLDIFEAGKNAGKVAYGRLQQRILQAGGAGAEEVKKRLASRAQQDKQQKDKETKKTGESEENTKESTEEKPDMRESTSRVSSFIFGS